MTPAHALILLAPQASSVVYRPNPPGVGAPSLALHCLQDTLDVRPLASIASCGKPLKVPARGGSIACDPARVCS
jgi:hypothetical protein